MISVDRVRLKTTTNYHSCLANKTIASGGEGAGVRVRGRARVGEGRRGWARVREEEKPSDG